MNVTVDQMVKVMEALAPEMVAAIRAGQADATKTGPVKFSENELLYTPDDVIKLAESAVPAWSRPDFSAKSWYRAAFKATRKLREAHSDAALAFLLRKGVQTIANDWYNVV